MFPGFYSPQSPQLNQACFNGLNGICVFILNDREYFGRNNSVILEGKNRTGRRIFRYNAVNTVLLFHRSRAVNISKVIFKKRQRYLPH